MSFTIGWNPGTTPAGGDGANDSGVLISTGDQAGAGGVILSTAGMITSMSIYIFATPGGNVLMGLYDNTGASGKAGTLVASCPSTALSSGWNTVNVSSQATLQAATYWLVFIVDTNTPNIGKATGAGPVFYLAGQSFALPSTSPALTSTIATFQYAMYATFNEVLMGQEML
jgi:hypothetical protein